MVKKYLEGVPFRDEVRLTGAAFAEGILFMLSKLGVRGP